MNASQIRIELQAILTGCEVLTHRDSEGDEHVDYILTCGTGETSFSLGHQCFAYLAPDVEAWLVAWEDGTASYATDGDDNHAEPYTSFCEDCEPESDRDLARKLAKDGLRLTEPGTCKPVLDDGEYVDARDGTRALTDEERAAIKANARGEDVWCDGSREALEVAQGACDKTEEWNEAAREEAAQLAENAWSASRLDAEQDADLVIYRDDGSGRYVEEK